MEYIDMSWKGSGRVYAEGSNRLILWRMYDNALYLLDCSLNNTYGSNSITFQLPGVIARNGIGVFETSTELIVGALTVSNTIHRLRFEKRQDVSLFHQLSSTMKQDSDTLNDIPYDVVISAVEWASKDLVAIGLSNGRVALHALEGHSFKYLEDAATGGVPFFSSKTNLEQVSILSVATLPIGRGTDFIVAAIATSGNLRLWSARDQSCRCSINVVSNMCTELRQMHLPCQPVEEIQTGMIKFMKSFPGDDFRLMVNASPAIDGIWLCRGKWKDHSCSMNVVRPFFLPLQYQRMNLVDFIPDMEVMTSIWETHGGIGFQDIQVVCCHEKPGAATGPEYIVGPVLRERPRANGLRLS